MPWTGDVREDMAQASWNRVTSENRTLTSERDQFKVKVAKLEAQMPWVFVAGMIVGAGLLVLWIVTHQR